MNITFMIVILIIDYVVGILLSNYLIKHEYGIFEKYNKPSFILYGPKEYRFLGDLLLFNNIKEYQNHRTKKILLGYKIFSYSFIVLIIYFIFN